MPDTPLTAETVRRLAKEVVGLPLTDAEVDALRSTLDGLLAEIRAIQPDDRSGAEPMVIFTAEGPTP